MKLDWVWSVYEHWDAIALAELQTFGHSTPVGVIVVHRPKLKRPYVVMYPWSNVIVGKDGGPAYYADGRFHTEEEATASAVALYKLGYRGKYAVEDVQ